MEIKTIEKEGSIKQLEIYISPEDYKDKVEKDLKKLRKETHIPGFRPGKVPMSLIRKKYEKPAKIQTINKLVEEQLVNFVRDNKIRLLGSFVPAENQEVYSFDEPEYVFRFDFSELPEVEVDWAKLKKIERYEFVHTDEDVENEIKYYRERHSKWEETDQVREGDIMAFIIDDENGEKWHMELGRADWSVKEHKKLFKGKKPGEVFEWTIQEAEKLFNWEPETLEKFKLKGFAPDEKLKFNLNKIFRQQLPELDKDFFKQIFPEKEIEDLEAFKKAVKEKLDEEGKTIGLNLYKNSISKKLGEVLKVEFPKDFMIRWLQSSGKEKISQQEAEKIYEESLDAYKLDVARVKFIDESGEEIKHEDIIKEAKSRILNYYMTHPELAQFIPADEQLEQMALDFLKEEQFLKEVMSQLQYELFLDILIDKIGKKPKQVKWSEFDKIQEKLNKPAKKKIETTPKTKKTSQKKTTAKKTTKQKSDEKSR